MTERTPTTHHDDGTPIVRCRGTRADGTPCNYPVLNDPRYPQCPECGRFYPPFEPKPARGPRSDLRLTHPDRVAEAVAAARADLDDAIRRRDPHRGVIELRPDQGTEPF